jgi:hypothetical protein
MPSYSETADVTCSRCGQVQAAEVWFIVDGAERPDLLERVKAGQLHAFACPACGQVDTVDAPLLAFRPDGDPALLFSPAQETTREQDQEHSRWLADHLRDEMGNGWREDWLAQGMSSVPRNLLPRVIEVGLEAVMQAEAERRASQQDQLPAEVRAVLDAVMASASASGARITSTEELNAFLAGLPDRSVTSSKQRCAP